MIDHQYYYNTESDWIWSNGYLPPTHITNNTHKMQMLKEIQREVRKYKQL